MWFWEAGTIGGAASLGLGVLCLPGWLFGAAREVERSRSVVEEEEVRMMGARWRTSSRWFVGVGDSGTVGRCRGWSDICGGGCQGLYRKKFGSG